MTIDLDTITMEELHAEGGRKLVIAVLQAMPYEQYLQTNHWKEVRRRTFQRHGYRCFVCGRTDGGIDVHHVNYENRGHEEPEDTQPLCREHHDLQHDILRQVMRARSHGQLGRFPTK